MWTPAEDIPHRDGSYIKGVWRQRNIPVVYRNKEEKRLLIKLPYSKDNKQWLRKPGCHRPTYEKKYKAWSTPMSWFSELVDDCLHEYGKVYVIQPYREQEKCAPACWNASGHICECSCVGMNHGLGDPGGRWYIVSDACAVQWHEKKLGCKLLIKKNHKE